MILQSEQQVKTEPAAQQMKVCNSLQKFWLCLQPLQI